MSFQFTKILIKKNRSKQFFHFHIYYFLGLVETFKLHIEKSDELKRSKMAFKVVNIYEKLINLAELQFFQIFNFKSQLMPFKPVGFFKMGFKSFN